MWFGFFKSYFDWTKRNAHSVDSFNWRKRLTLCKPQRSLFEFSFVQIARTCIWKWEAQGTPLYAATANALLRTVHNYQAARINVHVRKTMSTSGKRVPCHWFPVHLTSLLPLCFFLVKRKPFPLLRFSAFRPKRSVKIIINLFFARQFDVFGVIVAVGFRLQLLIQLVLVPRLLFNVFIQILIMNINRFSLFCHVRVLRFMSARTHTHIVSSAWITLKS